LRGVIPIVNMALLRKDRRVLKLHRPDGCVWPCCGLLLQIDWRKRQARLAVCIMETSYGIRLPVPAWIHLATGRYIAVWRVAKHITSVVQDNVENDIDAGSMGSFHHLHQVSTRTEMGVDLKEIVNPVAVVGVVEGRLLEEGADPYGSHTE